MDSKTISFLTALPVGYMTCFSNSEVPEGFIEIDGQRMIKKDNINLFNILRGNVIDDGDTFVLPNKEKISSMFKGFDPQKSKIILKIR